MATFEGVLMRRWRVVVVVVIAVGVVVVWSYLTPKQWEASIVVRLDPLVVPGLREDAAVPTPPGTADAAAQELAAARGATFQDGLASTASFPFDLTADPGPTEGTVRFTAQADSAERSVAGVYSAANGFLAWGRAQEAVGRQTALQRELDALTPVDPVPDNPAAGDLQARIDTAGAAIEQLAAGGGSVVTKPVVPDDPVSPDLTARMIVAAVVGLVAGLALAWALDRRRPGSPRLARPHGPAQVALAVVAVSALLLPLAGVVAGVVSVWELRPSTNAQDEAGYACLPGWLDDLPDDTVVAISGDSPRFFADHVQEFAFPRLTVAAPGTVPEVLVNIVAGPGPDPCGGYHREVTRP